MAMSDSVITNSDLIPVQALGDFLSLLYNSANENDVVENLGKSDYVRALLQIIVPDIKIRSLSSNLSNNEELVAILSELDDALDAKYATDIRNIQDEISNADGDIEISLNLKRRLGEILLILSVESSRATEIVRRIMAELGEESQLAIQTTIKKYARGIEYSDSEESRYNSELTLESVEEDEEKLQGQPRTSQGLAAPVVPPLSLGLLQKQLTMRKEKKDSFGITPHSGDKPGEPSLWKEKYEALKSEYRTSEALREEFQIKLEQLRKELEEQKQINERVTREAKEASSISQKNVGDAVDSLEREILELKKHYDDLVKEKKEQEKALTAEITTLKDENQLLSADVGRVTKLEVAVEKWKAKAEETGSLKIRNQELEKKIQDYMDRMIEVETANKSSLEIKRAVDLYKQKAVDLEAQVAALTSSNNELQARATQQGTNLEQAEKRRLVSDLKVQAVVAEYEAKLQDAQRFSDGGTGIDSDLNLREKLMRLEKENELLKKGDVCGDNSGKLLELEFKLDDAQRLKNKFEKEYQALLSKLTTLETSGNNPSQVENEKQLAIQQAQIESLQAQNKALKAQVDQHKTGIGLQEEVTKAKLESQYENIVTTLKDQIQFRERELNFLRLAREEQLSAQRREERLMSSAFHELGVRYFQLNSEKEKIAMEYEAVLLRMKKKRKHLQQDFSLDVLSSSVISRV